MNTPQSLPATVAITPVKRHQSVKEAMLSGGYAHHDDDMITNAALHAHRVAPFTGGSVLSLPDRFGRVGYLSSAPGSSLSVAGTSLGGNGDDENLPLPPNWAVEVTDEGIRYFVDHNRRCTHWIHPLMQEHLPPGWTKIFDNEHGVIYYNEIERRSQYEHPGLATPSHLVQEESTAVQQHISALISASAPSVSTPATGPNQMHSESGDQLHIPVEDIPGWLSIYSSAPNHYDHMLQWNLFRLPQLQQYEAMLLKLYKQDVINVVIKYERIRRAIGAEVQRRTRSIRQFDEDSDTDTVHL